MAFSKNSAKQGHSESVLDQGYVRQILSHTHTGTMVVYSNVKRKKMFCFKLASILYMYELQPGDKQDNNLRGVVLYGINELGRGDLATLYVSPTSRSLIP